MRLAASSAAIAVVDNRARWSPRPDAGQGFRDGIVVDARFANRRREGLKRALLLIGNPPPGLTLRPPPAAQPPAASP
jgi:hypothetical protein